MVFRQQYTLVILLIIYFMSAYWYKFIGLENSFSFKIIKDIIVLCTIYFLSLELFLTHKIKINKIFITYYIYMIFLAILGMVIFNNTPLVTLVGLRNYLFPSLMVMLIALMPYIKVKLVLCSFFKVVLFISIIGIILYYSPIDSYLIRLGGSERNVSLIGNPTSLAIIDAWGIMYYYSNKYIKYRIYYMFILFFSLILTSSSTGFLFLVIGFAYLNFNGQDGIKKTIIVIVIVTLLLLLFPRLYIGFVEFRDPSLLARLSLWSDIIHSTDIVSFFIGHGFGTAANLFVVNDDIISITDNSYIAMFYQFGFIFTIIFLAILYKIFKNIKLKSIKAMAIIYFIAAMAGNTIELGFPINYLFWILISIDYKLSQRIREKDKV